MTLSKGAHLGPYEILESIGAGGMGEVYRARDPRLGREVAVKILPAGIAADLERLRRFELEARATAALDHPGILAIHDLGTHDGTPFLVTELLQGETLRQRLQAEPPTAAKAVELAVQIARALAAAHEAGIVHRDLKPENLFLTRDGRVKILDFGLAKLIRPEPAGSPSTDAVTTPVGTDGRVVLGTVGYMAPEQVRGQPCDGRTDIFALGCVLYEMLSGQRAFRGETAADTISAILHQDPPPPAGPSGQLSPALQGILSRCLQKRPEERFSSAHDLALALELVSGSGHLQATTPVTTRRSGVLTGRRRTLAVAGGGLLLVALLAAGWLWRARSGAAGGPKRLAVLPFENLSGDPGQEYLSDGLTQEMIARLGQLHPASLSVIARTSVMRYKKTARPIDQIGRELDVDYVLEGSARREGDRVRITAELIQVKDQAQIWSESFERELSGILALQSDVARKVAGALALKLLPAEQARVATSRHVDPEAYEAYLKGLQHWYKLTPADLDAAQRYFEIALAKDPGYALAHAGVALLWIGRSQMGYTSPGEAAPKAKAAALKAIELDESVAETHYALALLRAWTEWSWADAEREFERAIELNPSFPDARAYYSHLLLNLGRPAEALPQMERALELDPFNSLFHSIYAVDLLYARRYDDAIVEARIALRTVPGDPVANTAIWIGASRLGRYAEALAAARTTYKTYEDPRVDEAFDRGAKEGGYRGAMKRAAEALVVHFRESYANPFDIACLSVEAGEASQAIDWLEKGYEVRDQNMPYLGWPLNDSLRSDPRFAALLRKMNLPVR